jgi:hypothetical protein
MLGLTAAVTQSRAALDVETALHVSWYRCPQHPQLTHRRVGLEVLTPVN